ncbi:MAG: hypothetical protein U1D69_01940, partial [Polynucleobacter sp.]|nr:hypothetical protein [Polynucleobacter sp.]
MPDWLKSEKSINVSTPIVMLDHQFANAVGGILENCRDIVAGLGLESTSDASGLVNRVSMFAQSQPELFLRLIEGRLRRSVSTHVLITDVDDPAARLFARASERAGKYRIFIPAEVFGPQEYWSLTAPMASALPMLAEVAIGWDVNHLEVFNAVGFPAERIRTASFIVNTQGRRAIDRELVLLSLKKSWPTDKKREPSDLTAFLSGLLGLTEVMESQLAIYLDVELYEKLPDQLVASLLTSDRVALEIHGAEIQQFTDRILDAAVVLCDHIDTAKIAWAVNVPTLMLDRDLDQSIASMHSARDSVALRALLGTWFDDPSQQQTV